MIRSVRHFFEILRRRSRVLNVARNALHLLRGRRVALGAWLLLDGEVCWGAWSTVSDGSRVTVPEGGRLVLGSGAWLDEQVRVEVLLEVAIGARSTVQRGCTLNGDIRIGRGCLLAPRVFISSGRHHFDLCPTLPIQVQDRLAVEGESQSIRDSRPVTVHDDCWLGTNVVLMPGVTIGRGAIVGANAVVTRDVAPYTIVVGVPARPIGVRFDFVPPREIDGMVEGHRPYFYSGFELTEALPPVADGPFALALHAENANATRLTLSNLSGAPVDVRHSGVSCRLGTDARTVLEFPLNGSMLRSGLLHFEIHDRVRVEVHSAELVRGVSHG